MQIIRSQGNMGRAQLDAVLGGKASERGDVQRYDDENTCFSNNEMRQVRMSHKVEKIIRDKEGRLVRATFYVYESAGRIKARLVNFVYISEISTKVFSLPGFISSQYSIFNILYSARRAVSPFVFKDVLHSLGSKPRAPTL